jgi:hypothetical protein
MFLSGQGDISRMTENINRWLNVSEQQQTYMSSFVGKNQVAKVFREWQEKFKERAKHIGKLETNS